MADPKPDLTRAGTMQVTAQEGIDYLHAAGKDKLLEAQGLVDAVEDDKPAVPRDSTMAVTAKEGETFLGEVGKPDEDALTRGQQRKLDEIQNEAEPSPKKPRLSKDNTMLETAKEAHAYIIGDDKLGETRSETKAKNAKPVTPKRTATMAATMEEAKYVLEGEDVDVSEGRKTRSRGKPNEKTPPVKRQGTMQSTAKEGEEFLSRGQDDDDDDDDEVEEVDDDGSDEENEDDS